MTRTFVTLALCGTALLLSSPGCKDSGVGDPCVPEQEYDPGFLGFDVDQVNVESKSFQCQTRLCLVHHFQGRVSCPFGQEADGTNPEAEGGKGCSVPGEETPITLRDASGNAVPSRVEPQCVDRTANKAVYCSCRCANLDGRTDDGANYCTCPEGFACQQLVTSIGQGDEGLTGAYCIKAGTEYNRSTACTGATCDPTNAECK